MEGKVYEKLFSRPPETRFITHFPDLAGIAVRNAPKPGRELTSEEIELLERYGPIESGSFDYENLRIVPRSREYFREQDVIHSEAFISLEEPELINIKSSDYEASYDDDIDMLALILHEIAHSCQSLCEGWRHGSNPRRGSVYVYRALNTSLHSEFDFEVLGPEQQASFLQDRMLANNGLPPALEGNRLKECVETAPPPDTGCVNGVKRDVPIEVMRDELNGITVPGVAMLP